MKNFKKHISRYGILLSASMLFISSISSAKTITVPKDFKTIQKAIDKSANGDIIVVNQGTYKENINFKNKNIILKSTMPKNNAVVSQTIIDGSESGPVITFAGKEKPSCVLSGFTITNGKSEEGGGIKGNGSLATIIYNVISNNTSYGEDTKGNGGGINDCDGNIQNNTISTNSASGQGGGIFRCSSIIQNNTITSNQAASGGAIALCNGIIQNNIISDNWAALHGGGIAFCKGTIQHNVFYKNNAFYGGGIAGSEAIIRNNIIWENKAKKGPQIFGSNDPYYCCIQGWTEEGIGIITKDPQFLNPEKGRFFLKQDSPCIDAGIFVKSLKTDIQGEKRGTKGATESRGDGSHFDIGIDEFNLDTLPSNVKNWKNY